MVSSSVDKKTFLNDYLIPNNSTTMKHNDMNKLNVYFIDGRA